jgi:tartrate-resistant acid phosphatase type 5
VADVSQTHFEPFLHLVDVTHDRALVAWGGFFFERSETGQRWRTVDDDRLDHLDPGRSESIGARSKPYGDAVVEAYDENGALAARSRTSDTNCAWLDGLAPDTRYTYRVTVDGEPWAEGERWDWGPVTGGGLDLAPRRR